MKNDFNNIKIVGCGFGTRHKDKTFSGVVRHLFDEMEQMGVLSGYLNTNQLRFSDALDGMMDFSKVFRYGRPGLSRKWLWRRKTVHKLSERFNRNLEKMPFCNVVLEVGTHILIHRKDVKHYCFTDMTIVQARNSPDAGAFSLNKLSREEAEEAIEAQKSIFQNCRVVFVPSHWVKKSVVDDYGIADDKVHIVFEGASIENGQCEYQKEYEPRILFIGRDWERKGGALLLKAFQKVREKIPNASLVIMGCSPKVNQEGVVVIGLLDKTIDAEKHAFHNQMVKASVLCLPSVFEPFGLCLVEAQYYGIPPVTFDGEGRRDAIIDGVTGLLVKQRSADAVADAIINLLSNPQQIKKMGEAGKKYVEENLTWKRVAERILRVISESEKHD